MNISLHLGALALLLGASGDARTTPAHDYSDAIARIERRQAADDSVVAPGGRSILMGPQHRTSHAYVLLHGFTDSPRQFEELGVWLAARGDNVYIPRLPHHAERSGLHALGNVRVDELTAFGDSVADVASGLGDTVTIVGLSAGGAIAGWLAQRRPDVFRVVLIAPAFAPGRISTSAEETGALMEIAARLPNILRSSVSDTTRPDLAQGITTRGLAEVMKLGAIVRRDAERRPARVARITVLLNENDNTVSGEASLELARTWTESSSFVLLYQFPSALRLPHNLLETRARGGNPDLVNPVLQALTVGSPPPAAARFEWLRCTSPGCA